MQTQPFFKAFVHAANGIIHFFRHDRNGKFHLVAAILVIAAGWYWRVSPAEWCVLLLCIALVIGLEMLNNALENLCNLVHADFHPLIKSVKDVAAAAVLWVAVITVFIASIIFIPKI